MRLPFCLSAVSTAFYLLLTVGCGPREVMPHVAIDLSSPKTAAVSFQRALTAGDLDSVRAATVGTDEQKKPAIAFATMLRGMRRYDLAIMKHFGNDAFRDDVELRQNLQELGDDRIERLQEGKVQENETEAMVSPGLHGMPLPKRPPIFLKKEKEIWKVDLVQTSTRDSSLTPEGGERNQAIGDALLKLAKDIERGRYKSYAEMQRDADAGIP